MYYLSVGAIFKNESHIMREWVQHYLFHGVEHFYLINDKSTDDYMEVIQEYIDAGKITLFHADEPQYCGRQSVLYNRHILPRLKETKWLLIVDLDEFVWSKQNTDMTAVLRYSESFGQLQINEYLFGSNGHETQPKNVVSSFTKRRKEYWARYKYFVNSSFEFSSLNVHYATFAESRFMTDSSVFLAVYPEYFVLNHYNCQSREFWNRVKCTRGDSDSYLIRTPEKFTELDCNEVEDMELCGQNKPLYETPDHS
jgi:hypothetical protein